MFAFLPYIVKTTIIICLEAISKEGRKDNINYRWVPMSIKQSPTMKIN
jgi:hypothetical protein